MTGGDGSSWDDYWRRTAEAAAFRGGGVLDEVLNRFWADTFGALLGRLPGARLLDLGCGNGALLLRAREAAGRAGVASLHLYGLDRSPAAARDAARRVPGAVPVVASAARAPFPDASFELVASQFGAEYAGPAGLDEAGRLAARWLAAVVHARTGALGGENEANLAAARRLAASQLLPAAKAFFLAREALERGRGSRPALRQAEQALEQALRAVDELLAGAGPQVAGGVVARLRGDIVHMRARAAAYDPREVAAWVDRNAAEVEAYAGRMASMLEAALDEAAFRDWAGRLAATGFTIRAAGPLNAGAAQAAWLLVAERR